MLVWFLITSMSFLMVPQNHIKITSKRPSIKEWIWIISSRFRQKLNMYQWFLWFFRLGGLAFDGSLIVVSFDVLSTANRQKNHQTIFAHRLSRLSHGFMYFNVSPQRNLFSYVSSFSSPHITLWDLSTKTEFPEKHKFKWLLQEEKFTVMEPT